MDFTDVVQNRKAIRNFLPKPIEEEKINTILNLTNLAPSAGNLQAYKIFIIQKKEIMRLIEANVGGAKRNLADVAPLVLIFCANPQESANKYGEKGIKTYSIQDATIACAYAQLIATSLQLGSCWFGSFDEKQVQKVIHTDLFPVSLLLIGYASEAPPRRPRKSLSQLSEIL